MVRVISDLTAGGKTRSNVGREYTRRGDFATPQTECAKQTETDGGSQEGRVGRAGKFVSVNRLVTTATRTPSV